MSHIYQPVMLIELIEGAGRASINQIARAFLGHDKSQEEYYEAIVKSMPGRILKKHGLVNRDGDDFELLHFSDIQEDERALVLEECHRKLDEFIKSRGKRIWSHRRKSSGYISGTLRYEILKEARFRCELCGVSAEDRALEVDHIQPRNKGGGDEMSNLQALCYQCNAMKQDRDNTDFRLQDAVYEERDSDCPFCDVEEARIIKENELAFVIKDAYPTVEGHVLVIPKRHVSSYWEITRPERNACDQLLLGERDAIQSEDSSVDGFNIGVNDGVVAGQTVLHCHIHLIPRRSGDVESPRGGVRRVIPGKQDYVKSTNS